ncbi:MAG: protein-glutamate methylesterase/protein-glutamine glutaminase [Planctomycetota bacterium]|jgi:two-component system chemotaxis response regulator CheB
MTGRVVRVLVVDDSALVREVLATGLNKDPGIEVVGTASDPYVARDKIVQLKPDVLTLDVEMPRMDGVAFLRRLMPQYPLPVVMVSSLTERGKKITLDALDAGAVDFVAKPKADMVRGLGNMLFELATKVKIASTANVSHYKSAAAHRQVIQSCDGALAESTDKVVVIGASTGGTEAIREVISALPATAPGVVIVQHMPSGFTKLFADRMNQLCAMEVKEAAHDDRIMPGRILIAPGGMQMSIRRSGGTYRVEVKPGELVNGHCPSVEVLMASAAKYVGTNAVGVMLTGMGADGADAMKQMRDAGARCIAQDEATCVVFGMPKEAHARGGAEALLPLNRIAAGVLNLLTGKNP